MVVCAGWALGHRITSIRIGKNCCRDLYGGLYCAPWRRSKTKVSGFFKPLLLLGFVALLLLREPDFGATTVILVTCMGMLFLAGVRLWQFAILLGFVIAALIGLAITSPYRLERLTTFLNPWANQFDSGYQLTQSLIAFGRGGWFGVGLGDSVQKLFYLPEAYTDFLFAETLRRIRIAGWLSGDCIVRNCSGQRITHCT